MTMPHPHRLQYMRDAQMVAEANDEVIREAAASLYRQITGLEDPHPELMGVIPAEDDLLSVIAVAMGAGFGLGYVAAKEVGP